MKTNITTITEALAVLDKIEFSGDGHIRLHPYQAEWEQAVTVIKKHLKGDTPIPNSILNTVLEQDDNIS